MALILPKVELLNTLTIYGVDTIYSEAGANRLNSRYRSASLSQSASAQLTFPGVKAQHELLITQATYHIDSIYSKARANRLILRYC